MDARKEGDTWTRVEARGPGDTWAREGRVRSWHFQPFSHSEPLELREKTGSFERADLHKILAAWDCISRSSSERESADAVEL